MPKRPATPKSSPAKKQRTLTRKSVWKSKQGFESTVPRFPKSAFPFSLTATLKYCESYTQVNPGAGQSSAYIYRANDLFDPNYTGVGHQPTGFDQYMAMYNKFVVIASKIKVIGFNNDAETNDVIGGIAIMDNVTVQTTAENYMEQPLADWSIITGGAGAASSVNRTAFDSKVWSNTDIYTNDLLFGSSSSTPTKMWYYHVFAAATEATANPGNINFAVEIEYKVKFFDPKSVSIS